LAAGAAGRGAAGVPSATTLVGDVALRSPVAELVSLVAAVSCAAGFAGLGAGGVAGAAPDCTGAAEAPAPGESVRDTSAFNGSPGAVLAGLSAAAAGGVAVESFGVAAGVTGGFVGSSAIYV
jgi:hypothetical protein